MHAHLVGSIGLDTVDEVFRTVGEMLGPYLRRVPDGEVGGRKLWISWQYPLLRASVYLRPDPSGAIRPTNRFPLLTLAEGVAPSEVRFGELGYAREARASYLDFVAAREAGTLPKGRSACRRRLRWSAPSSCRRRCQRSRRPMSAP